MGRRLSFPQMYWAGEETTLPFTSSGIVISTPEQIFPTPDTEASWESRNLRYPFARTLPSESWKFPPISWTLLGIREPLQIVNQALCYVRVVVNHTKSEVGRHRPLFSDGQFPTPRGLPFSGIRCQEVD